MLISWDDLRFLEALERLGSARAAGRELGVAPSTVYRRVSTLEAAVGFPCLKRGDGLTTAGRELAELGRSTGGALDRIARRAKEDREAVRGRVTLTTIDGFAPLLVAPLAALAATSPRLQVDVHISDGGLSLRKRQAEVGLSVLETPPGTLVGRKLFPVRFGVYARRDLASDEQSARWITLGAPLQVSWLGRWESQNVPADRIAIASPSRRLLTDLIAAGVGIGLMPARLAELVPDLVEITRYRASTAALTRHAWALTHAEAQKDARVVAVMKALATHLARREALDTSPAADMIKPPR